MKKQKLDKTLTAIVKRLVQRFDPDQIILFGSHARGAPRVDSDIDLLVVLPVTGLKRAKQVEMRVRDIVGTIIHPALRELPANIRPDLTPDEHELLTDYAVSARYPGDWEPISLIEARRAVQIARRVRKQFRDLLPPASLK